MPKPKTIIEEESIRLIKYITQFEDDDENLQICERFVLSNLFYHKYLDPDERKINKIIQGVKEKFIIHAQFEKAEAFEDLVKKFRSSPAFEGSLDQHDISYRLLSLVLNLAENPVNVDFEARPPDTEPEEERIDWLGILREGEQCLTPLGSESELSDWSEEDDEDSDEKAKGPHHTSQPQTGDSRHGHVFVEEKERANETNNWLKDNIQFPYWNEEQKFPETSANFSGHVEKDLERRGKLDVRTEKITEYQLLREIIWMLRTPTDSPVFEFRNGEFKVTDLVTLPSLTDSALKTLLEEVLPTFSHIFCIKEFIHNVEHPGPGVVVARTVEAYTSSLSSILLQFSDHLLQAEQQIVEQDKTLTTIMFLENIRPWANKIKFIRNIHHLATQDFFETEDNCYKSMRILSVVYNSLIASIHNDVIDTLMDMFLISVRPYLRILEVWLCQGKLFDHRQEFIFYHNPQALEENLWSNLYKQRNYVDPLTSAGIRPLALFSGLADKILLSGKSNAILTKMDRLSTDRSTSSQPSKQLSEQTSVYDEFVANIKSRIPRVSDKARKADKMAPLTDESKHENPPNIMKSEAGGQETYQEIIQSAEDEFLATAFKNIFTKMEECLRPDSVKEDGVLGVALDPLVPLESIMADSLSIGVLRHYTTSCSALIHLFTEDLRIEEELGRARLVFFMEAGDIMQDFNHQIFQIIHRRDTDLLDSSSLTLLLQDCLSQRFGGWADQFSCVYSAEEEEEGGSGLPLPSIAGLSISMHIAWPLNIILSPEKLVVYNKIYLFLVGVKHSLWCLQSVSLKQICRMDQQLEKEESSLELSDSSLTAGEKKHRVQLLRTWLLYFVTLLHGYFMSRVVHSTHLELSEGISGATDLNMLIEVHETYLKRIHDRCFLHPGVSMLKKAISIILGICLELHAGVLENNIHTRTIDAWEEKYAKCHNFLASTLNSMVRKSKLPHLEGLAAALSHSCPQQQ